MTIKGQVRTLEELHEGAEVSIPFRISEEDMETFARLSGDLSRVHTDAEFARSRGFDGVVVYAALTAARLSNLVGMHMPGDLGLSTGWRFYFNQPLYVNEDAVLSAVISQISVATRTVVLKFRVTAGDRLISRGTASSMLLDEPRD